MLTSRQPHKVTAGEKKRKELKSGQCDVTLSKHDRCQTKIGNADFVVCVCVWFFFFIYLFFLFQTNVRTEMLVE